MTQYAFDQARNALVAVRDQVAGKVAPTVAELPRDVSVERGLRLSDALTTLSRFLWWTYTHPASATDNHEPNSEGWLRQEERKSFAEVVPAIRKPHLPGDHGLMTQCYSPVEESSHRVGRVLHEIADQDLADRIVADVEEEMAAIEQAERGELSGRAHQAVTLSRADASPLQVAAADALLHLDPLGSSRLFDEVEPTAASVAAAHWLQAAADVTAQVADIDPTMVVAEADNIEALAVRTPSRVLELLNADDKPRNIVTGLIAEALEVAEGRIPNIAALLQQIVEAGEKAEQYGARADEARDALMPDRVTPLDPSRPSQDLLEDLLDGIRGCWLLHREYVDELDDSTFSDTDEEEYEHREAERDEAFVDAVRLEATAQQERLL